jgi:hypothetical protein
MDEILKVDPDTLNDMDPDLLEDNRSQVSYFMKTFWPKFTVKKIRLKIDHVRFCKIDPRCRIYESPFRPKGLIGRFFTQLFRVQTKRIRRIVQNS